MAQDQIYNDLLVVGQVVATQGILSGAASITDAMVSSVASISTSKLQHRFEHAIDLNGNSSTAAAAIRRIIHVVKGATGTIEDFSVGAVTAAVGAATVTIDLKKNGSSILTATISLDSSTAAFILKQPAGFTSTTVVAGDVLEAQITAAVAGGGTLPNGVFARLTLSETYA